MKTVVCPGSFDPITNGHIDIISRASELFDRVIVLVAQNLEKKGSFTHIERVEMINTALGDIKGLNNVYVDSFSGLLVDYIDTHEVSAVVKGIRAVSDFEYEVQMSLLNRRLHPKFETIFFTPSEENSFVSSSIVRQVATLGGDISRFVPKSVEQMIYVKLCKGYAKV